MVKKEKEIKENHELDDDMMKHVDTSVGYDKSFNKYDLQYPLLEQKFCATKLIH